MALGLSTPCGKVSGRPLMEQRGAIDRLKLWLVPRTRGGWVLTALLLLLVFCTLAYSARDTLYKTYSGLQPDTTPHGGPAFEASEKLELTKTAGGAMVTLKWAYAEEKDVVLGYDLEDLKDERHVAGHPAGLLVANIRLSDESGTEIRLPDLGSQQYHLMGMRNSIQAHFKAKESLEPSEKHRFRLEISLMESVPGSREFRGPNGQERPPPEPVGRPLVFGFEIPVRPDSVVEVNQKATAKGVTLTLDRVINSPGRPLGVFCYEPPDEEHVWTIYGGKGTYLQGWGMSHAMAYIPPAKCQKLMLEAPVEDLSMVEVTMIEGMPDCRSVNTLEALEACERKIGNKMIRGLWRFEFKVPDSAGGDRPPREAEGDGGGA
jgi:hypothetical protein